MDASDKSSPHDAPRAISLREAFPVWRRLAALSFNGPAGQIAVMHRILVDEKRWISEERFLHALNYCMLLPGPEAQQLATYIGWLMPGEMLDGRGMAETTPGPLIMVVQFVGFMGAYRHPGPLDPLAAGVLGSLVTTWVTFVPCFFWIFLGAPYIERLRGNRLLGSALSAITAAVVGVILNLAVWFALHVLFAHVDEHRFGPVRVLLPPWSTLNVAATAIAALACGLTFYWRRGMAVTLATCACVGALVYLVWPAAR